MRSWQGRRGDDGIFGGSGLQPLSRINRALAFWADAGDRGTSAPRPITLIILRIMDIM